MVSSIWRNVHKTNSPINIWILFDNTFIVKIILFFFSFFLLKYLAVAFTAIPAGQPYLQNSVMQLKQKTPTAGELGTEIGELFLGSYRWLQQSPLLHNISSITYPLSSDLGFNCTECNQMPSWRFKQKGFKLWNYQTKRLFVKFIWVHSKIVVKSTWTLTLTWQPSFDSRIF